MAGVWACNMRELSLVQTYVTSWWDIRPCLVIRVVSSTELTPVNGSSKCRINGHLVPTTTHVSIGQKLFWWAVKASILSVLSGVWALCKMPKQETGMVYVTHCKAYPHFRVLVRYWILRWQQYPRMITSFLLPQPPSPHTHKKERNSGSAKGLASCCCYLVVQVLLLLEPTPE